MKTLEKDLSNAVDKLFSDENYKGARSIIEKALKKEPKNHWLITQLGTTYYEERKYAKALELTEKALKIAPRCPLVLWDKASCLDMLGREAGAIAIWKRLINRGFDELAYGECGEGLRWAKSLLNDCGFRIGKSLGSIGKYEESVAYLKHVLIMRQRGIPSLYDIRDVRKELAEVQKKL